MSKVVITKGKLLKDDKVEIYFKRIESNITKPVTCSEDNPNPPKQGLKDSFAALTIHAALLGEFISTALVKDFDNINPDLVKDYHVTSFSISGGDDDEAVVITAHKKLKSEKTLGFNTPVTRFSDESKNAYHFMDKLIDAITDCRDHLTKHLNGDYGETGEIKFPKIDPL